MARSSAAGEASARRTSTPWPRRANPMLAPRSPVPTTRTGPAVRAFTSLLGWPARAGDGMAVPGQGEKLAELYFTEVPDLPRPERPEVQRPELAPDELDHGMPDRVEHPPHHSVPAGVQGDLQQAGLSSGPLRHQPGLVG